MEELPSMQLEAEIVELSKLVKDKYNVPPAIQKMVLNSRVLYNKLQEEEKALK